MTGLRTHVRLRLWGPHRSNKHIRNQETIGEHFVASATTLFLVGVILRATHLKMPGSGYAGLSLTPVGVLFLDLLCVVVDVSASLELASIQSTGGNRIKL